MRLLLDTHAFLWWVGEDERLSGVARRRIGDPDNDVFVSAVTACEIVIKWSQGRLRLPESPERFVPTQLQANAFNALPLHLRHALGVTELPDLHRDPFDRMLVAQARAEHLTLVTSNDEIRRYPVEVLW